jgi:hypothetical protein
MRHWAHGIAFAGAAIVLLMASLLGRAADLAIKQPTVDYSADMVRESARGTRTSKVFYTPGHLRMENQLSGRGMTTIIDRENKKMINLDQKAKSYFEIDLAKMGVSDDSLNGEYTKTFLGKETIDGIETSKYAYEGQTGDTHSKGTVWLTTDSIALRVQSTVDLAGQTYESTTHLENLKIEHQDPGLFTVPADYTLRQMPGRPDAQGQGQMSGKKAAP